MQSQQNNIHSRFPFIQLLQKCCSTFLTASLTACYETATNREEAAACSKKLGRALRGSHCFSSTRPLLHAKLLDSELCAGLFCYNMPPLNSSGLARSLMCDTHSVLHVPTPPSPPSPTLPSLAAGAQWDVQYVGVCSISEPVLTRSPVSVPSSNQLTESKGMNAKHRDTHTHTPVSFITRSHTRKSVQLYSYVA